MWVNIIVFSNSTYILLCFPVVFCCCFLTLLLVIPENLMYCLLFLFAHEWCYCAVCQNYVFEKWHVCYLFVNVFSLYLFTKLDLLRTYLYPRVINMFFSFSQFDTRLIKSYICTYSAYFHKLFRLPGLFFLIERKREKTYVGQSSTIGVHNYL